MIHFQKTTLWLAALSALVGLGCIGAFLFNRQIEGDLLFGASMAAVFGTASLVVGLLLICTWPLKPERLPRRLVAPMPAEFGAKANLAEQYEYRQEVLGERFNIDEPHFCTQAKAPCTAWSFCGSDPDMHNDAGKLALETDNAATPQSSLLNPQSLPLIRRDRPAQSCLALAADTDFSGRSKRQTDNSSIDQSRE